MSASPVRRSAPRAHQALRSKRLRPDQELPDSSPLVAGTELKTRIGSFASWTEEQHPDAAESLRVGIDELVTASPTAAAGAQPAAASRASAPVASPVSRSMVRSAFVAPRHQFGPNRPKIARRQPLPDGLGGQESTFDAECLEGMDLTLGVCSY